MPLSTARRSVAGTFILKRVRQSTARSRAVSPADRIVWIQAGVEHRSHLESFICTDPPSRVWDPRARIQLPHPHPWSLAVQADLHQKHPPLPPDEALLLGFIDAELALISNFGWTRDPGDYPQLLVLAVARSIKFHGARLGDELMTATLQLLRQTRDQAEIGCGAVARIHPRNVASKKLFERAGFFYLDDYEDETKLEYWVHDLL